MQGISIWQLNYFARWTLKRDSVTQEIMQMARMGSHGTTATFDDFKVQDLKASPNPRAMANFRFAPHSKLKAQGSAGQCGAAPTS